MTVYYPLNAHTDYGYDKFFATFRDEYDVLWNWDNKWELRDALINKHLSKFNCRLIRQSYSECTLEFDTEADFTFFVLKWS